MNKLLNKIKQAIKNINFKSKRTILLISFFVFAIATGVILISYGAYISTGSKNLIFGGTATVVQPSDVLVKMYLENTDNSGNGLGTYTRSYTLPNEGYVYNGSLSYCSAGLTINSYNKTTQTFDISSTTRGYCKVYFDSRNPDSVFSLYVEQTEGAGNYTAMSVLPTPATGKEYVIDETLTTCNDENAVVEIENNVINVTSSMNLECEIYANLETIFTSKDFTYSGAVEPFTVPKTGYFKLQVWGASGGYGYGSSSSYYIGGKGGYSEGQVYLTKGTIIYAYVGGQGTNGVASTLSNGGFNGGGKSGYNYGGSGGGATDIRIGTDSLYYRVIVAGGGGGGGYYNTSNARPGGYGGGIGGSGTGYNAAPGAKGGTFLAGGAGGTGSSYTTAGVAGTFGTGGNAVQTSSSYNRSGGGGGGWYGGGGGGYYNSSTYYYYALSSGGGGSGWIYTAGTYSAWSTTTEGQSGSWGLNSNYYLKYATTIGGNESFPTTDGSSTETGHTGSGYAILTYVGKTASSEAAYGSSFTSKNFTYTGATDVFVVPKTGNYTLEVWGAQGGSYSTTYAGGKGGYSNGTVLLEGGDVLFINVGGEGSLTTTKNTAMGGGFNGGGNAYSINVTKNTNTNVANVTAGGGGASDIRINFNALEARVIVAGGGGGGNGALSYKVKGGAGGGTSGIAVAGSSTYKGGGAGTISAAGTSYYGTTVDSTSYGTLAAFGTGGSGKANYIVGGGGGWYGGGYARRSGGGGGSGYVYTAETASYCPTGCKLETKYQMTNATTVAGNVANTIPTTSGSGYETGHAGNGYARITYAD